MLHRLLSLLLCVCHVCDVCGQVQVHTPQGTATVMGLSNSAGYSYLGIPYAQVPLGPLRFQNAQRLDPSGVVDATAYRRQCIQSDDWSSQDEDCLGINIFTPLNATPSSRLPVFFYIHGGGLTEGNGNMDTGVFANLVNRGPLLLVSINYRLGPFGFYSTRDGSVPGNAGFSDQIEALHWVQRYISFFGGDPQRVTIGGESSGAESVSALTFTNAATGLFSQIIQMSGSAFGTGLWSYDERTRNTSQQLAVQANCSTTQQWASGARASAVACLRGQSASAVWAASEQIEWYGSSGYLYKWGPVQDSVLFPDRLESAALQRRPMNVLAGVCGSEWLIAYLDYFQNGQLDFFTLQNVTQQFREGYEMTYWDNASAVMEAALNTYFYSVNAADNNYITWANQTIQAWGDLMNTGPLLRDLGYYHMLGSRSWLYSFDWLSPNALTYLPVALRGVPHAWDMQYLEGHAGWQDQFQPTSDDLVVQKDLFGQIWTNFVVFGDPMARRSGVLGQLSAWPTYDASLPYLSLQPTPRVGRGFHPSARFFACTAPTMDGHTPPFC